MSDSSLTIADLFPSSMKIDPQKMRLGADTPTGDDGLDSFLQSKMREGVASALSADVLEMIAHAWAKCDELKGIAGKGKQDSASHVYLAKHDVVCENTLKVALEFAGVPTVTDHLQLKLTAMFEGIGVTVDSGYIVGVDAGRGSAKAQLMYSNEQIVGSSTDWVKLPASHLLKHPIEIARANST